MNKIHLSPGELEQALEDRLYYTLLAKLGNKGQGLMRVLNGTSRSFGKPGKIGKIFARFVRTTINLGKIGVHHSPIGILTTTVDAIKNKSVDLQKVSRVVVGSAAGLMLWDKIQKDPNLEIRGAAENNAQRQAWDKEDYPEQSIRITNPQTGEKKAYEFENNAPATHMLSFLATAMQFGIRKAEGMNIWQNVTQTAMEGGKLILKESYLDTPQQFIQLLTDMRASKGTIVPDDPDQSAFFTTPIGKWFGRFIASQTVPNIITKATKVGIPGLISPDPVKRTPRNLEEFYKAKMPNWDIPVFKYKKEGSKAVPETLSWDGTPFLRKGESFITPVRSRTDESGKLDRELVKLKIYPTPPRRTTSGIPLTPKERRDMTVKFGPKLRKFMERVVNSKGWDRLGKATVKIKGMKVSGKVLQQKFLKQIISAANKYGYRGAGASAVKRFRSTAEGRAALRFFVFGGLAD